MKKRKKAKKLAAFFAATAVLMSSVLYTSAWSGNGRGEYQGYYASAEGTGATGTRTVNNVPQVYCTMNGSGSVTKLGVYTKTGVCAVYSLRGGRETYERYQYSTPIITAQNVYNSYKSYTWTSGIHTVYLRGEVAQYAGSSTSNMSLCARAYVQ